MKKYSLPTAALLMLLLFFGGGGSGCANMIAPTGGPKDTLPPVLENADPRDSVRNFSGNKIVLTFDEFVDLQNPRENLIVNPAPKIEPVTEAHLKTITIKIKDTLQPNTTYTLNFGNAIKDINEGNIYKNFTYVFSTGKYLDSLELEGNVIRAETGEADSTLLVMLHTLLDDSAVVKERPRYVAKTDGKGHFHFRHLPPGTFALYALQDEGGMRKFTSPKQLFAFAPAPVQIGKDSASATLYAYLEKEKPDTSKKAASAAKPLAKKASPDKNKEKDKRLRYHNNLENGMQDLLSDFELSYEEPLKKADSTKILLLDEKFQPLKGYTYSRDSSNKKITLAYHWVENTGYNLIIDKEFAEDTAGHKMLKTDTVIFRTQREREYGNVKLRFKNLDLSLKPVLLIFQGDALKEAHPLSGPQFNARLFKPGEYSLRILYDSNGNGKWDPGEFFGHHTQPEKVRSIPRKLSVKANWDNDVTIEL